MLCMKSSPDYKQLQNRLQSGYRDIELQLINEVTNMPVESGINVYSVHSPLDSSGAINIEDRRSYEILKQMLLFYPNKPLIFHTRLGENELDCYAEHFIHIIHLCNKYPDASLVIENGLIADYKHGRILISNGHLFENVAVVKYFRKILGFDRIYTCLDICHMMGTINFMRNNNKFFANIPSPKDFFENNADYCKIVHIANAINDASTYQNHAAPITSQKTALNIAKFLYEYMPNAIYVVEVNDTDYLNIVNAMQTHKNIKQALKMIENKSKLNHRYSIATDPYK